MPQLSIPACFIALVTACGAQPTPGRSDVARSDGFHERVLRGCQSEAECKQLSAEAMVRAISCPELEPTASLCRQDAVRASVLYADRRDARERAERVQLEAEQARQREAERLRNEAEAKRLMAEETARQTALELARVQTEQDATARAQAAQAEAAANEAREKPARLKRSEKVPRVNSTASSDGDRLLCCDGTLSPSCSCSGSHRGCCSHHRGVCGCQ